MFKKIIPILLILISINAYSQKCKTDKDPFTDEIITSFDFHNKIVYFEIKNDSITFTTTFFYRGERKHEFNEGSEILFKLEEGSKIGLKTIKKTKPKIENVTTSKVNPFLYGFGGGFNTGNSQNYTTYSFTFSLTKNELKKLAESKIEIIRIPDTDEGEHADLLPKGETKQKMKAIKRGASCIMESI